MNTENHKVSNDKYGNGCSRVGEGAYEFMRKFPMSLRGMEGTAVIPCVNGKP